MSRAAAGALLSCISSEKTLRFPLRSSIRIRHRNEEVADDFLVERRSREIHGLIDVVGRSVIALGRPLACDGGLRRVRPQDADVAESMGIRDTWLEKRLAAAGSNGARNVTQMHLALQGVITGRAAGATVLTFERISDGKEVYR